MKHFGIVFMPKDYLSILSLSSKYKQEIDCLDEIFFYFLEKDTDSYIKTLTELPSPQLILKNNNNFSYIKYNYVLKYINNY